ncbi:MAG: tRNA modification GTPase MnmE, partial [Planctomycetota bacterium]
MGSPARDTIVAVGSPPGRGLRAIVRASGPGVRAAADAVLGMRSPRRGIACARARTALGSCPVLAMWMDEGASFTGEDSLEVSCVGAPALVDALVDALIEGARKDGLAARRARAGEFAFRAHLAGRLTVDEAESIAARIAATSDAELVAADEVASGTTGARAAEVLGRVAELLALVEAGIDFTDQEDVVAIAPAVLARASAELADVAASLRGAQGSVHALATPLVVLAGAPNAGKSTLFNALLGRERSVASELAGTTRDAIVERIRLGRGIEADLADLAGLDGDACGASAAIHRDMQRRAAQMLASADVVVRCTRPGESRLPLDRAAVVVDVRTMADLGMADPSASCGGVLSVSARTG